MSIILLLHESQATCLSCCGDPQPWFQGDLSANIMFYFRNILEGTFVQDSTVSVSQTNCEYFVS